MSAKKPPRLAGLGRRKKLVVVCLAIACALIAVGLYAWQSQPVPEAGASVTTAEGKSRQEIQGRAGRSATGGRQAARQRAKRPRQ